MTDQSVAPNAAGSHGLVHSGKNIASRDEAVALAQALVPQLRTRARQADNDRKVPAENIAALKASGLIRLTAPKAFGGSQLGLGALFEAVAEVGSGCGSTGWVYGVFAGHNWMLSLFPVEAQREIFGDPDALVASVVRLGGNPARRGAGGFEFEGAFGKFCSGVDHANWIMAGASVVDQETGSRDQRYFLIPKSEFEVVDDWFTVGLRGTGSKSLKLARAFVPEHRACSFADMVKGNAPGSAFHDSPVYRMPIPQILRFHLSGTPIGIARGALNAFSEIAGKKLADLSEGEAAEQGALFARLSNAAADIDSAVALLLRDAAEIDRTENGSLTPRFDRARYMRDIAYAVNKCRHAINSLYEAGGGSAIYDSVDLQRIWRDMNSAAAHNAFMRDKVDTAFGRAALGMPPSKFDALVH
jgi:3-hydroxy-9,10-secoandrosta-1,3,5(10)-triene-9,17-dione monooxygenase